jgi:hypothetical protein
MGAAQGVFFLIFRRDTSKLSHSTRFERAPAAPTV